MPYLHLNTNVDLDAEKSPALMSRLSKLLAQETGKPEHYVMVNINGSGSMLFGGNVEPLAYVECKSIGLTPSQAKSLSAAIAHLLNAELSIADERVYIEFSNCPAEFWGWNGGTFA